MNQLMNNLAGKGSRVFFHQSVAVGQLRNDAEEQLRLDVREHVFLWTREAQEVSQPEGDYVAG